MKKCIRMTVLLLCMFLCLSACTVKPDPDMPIDGPNSTSPAVPQLPAEVVSFSFSESHSYRKLIQGYEFKAEDGKYTAYFWIADKEEPMAVPVDQAWANELRSIVYVNSMVAWNGFCGTDSMLLDGTSFHVSFTLADGIGVSASGYGDFPEYYGSASEAIDELFLSVLPEDMPEW